MTFSAVELFGVGIGAMFAGAYFDEWVISAALVVLWLGFKLLVTGDKVPVLFLAFLFQWIQVTVGVFYLAMTGRAVPTVTASDYRPMVWIGLGIVLSLAIGLRIGVQLMRRRRPIDLEERPIGVLSWPALLGAYVVSVVAEGALFQLSTEYYSLKQIFVTMTIVRLGLLFLVMRRLCRPVFRWQLLGVLLLVEVTLGISGFYAGFREPIILAVLAMLESFDYRKSTHWLAFTGLLGVMVLTSIVWMGVRVSYRRDYVDLDALSTSQSARINRIGSLSRDFLSNDFGDMAATVDGLVDRMWVVYYPALALPRVPAMYPHTNGTILLAAIQHVLTPRVFFPNKIDLPSDSDMVRKYSGVMVAGPEQGTSIAFGYAIESYIDFGIPLMFLPMLCYGVLMGLSYGYFIRAIWHRELAVSLVTVVYWLALYLFERSWAMTLGYSVSLIVYLGAPVVLLDRFLLVRFFAQKERQTSYEGRAGA